ncbi:glutathione S-transferase family protein [Serratia rubidaea]|uniref:Glutathione S-transferase family protein n=1 Tax=Serratia rubidaea TaxID=61652 RepID=A0ABS0MHI8_SERRU|nr:glutathione S-transferase family protein [Serratia rubidaea]MBH1930964.1 glutathione S-transferase family protein [Serratia rubidaea]
MKVYTFPKSRSLRVLWVLEELRLNYETVRVDLLAAAPTVSSPHPQHKVPVLDDEGFVIFESAAICKYLCAKTARQRLYPAELRANAGVEQWLSFTLNELEPPLWALLKHTALLPDARKVAAVAEVARQEADVAITCLARQPFAPWITGETFTLADIFTAQNLMWATACGISLPPALEAYLQRCQAREAYQQAVMRNNG